MALGIESFSAIWLSQLKFLMNEFLIKNVCTRSEQGVPCLNLGSFPLNLRSNFRLNFWVRHS